MHSMRRVLTGLGLWVWMSLPALAQVPAKPGPPPDSNTVPSYIVGIALLAIVCLGAIKNARRSHQD